MTNTDLFRELEKLLRMEGRYCSEDGVLLKNSIVEAALALRPDLIRMLLSHEGLRANFFTDVDGLLVFDKVRFQKFVMNKRFLPDSYTSFKNKIGLTGDGGDFLAESREVVLSWPYKDCVLEGGQTKEDAKRNEVFWNEILAPDEINRLTEPKVLTAFKRYTTEGEEQITNISREDNLIIKGNNLLALHSLKKSYAGKVKLIYIDPPYNTGNDGFQYNDSFNHSSWLTFMRNRLTVARELLKEDGSIWISCDDSEQAYLKVLCDEVFSRSNFLTTFVWRRRKTQANLSKHIAPVHDFILCIAKNKEQLSFNKLQYSDEYIKKSFSNPDNDPRGLYQTGPLARPANSSNKEYMLVMPNGREITAKWSCSQSTFDSYVAENKLVIPRDGEGMPRIKIFLSELNGQIPNTWLDDIATNDEASKEIESIFGTIAAFSYPKPEKLIQYILNISTNPNDIVLDYHLGSGTTAAVAHKMGRRYIGIEQMDYIETVAVERLRKVIGTKKANKMFGDEYDCDQGGISKAISWQGGGSFVYCELAKANQNFADDIEAAATKEQLTAIWERMQQTGFLSWKLSPAAINDTAREFADLSMADTRRFLIESLDKNLLYVPLSEINNTEFSISDEDKNLNSQFYGN